MGITAFYGPPLEDEKALALLRGVYRAGCSHFDTAELYRAGKPYKYNESVLGQFLREIPRESVTIASKFMPPLHKNKCHFEIVSAALDASLERLGTPFVDIYYLHRMPSSVQALQEWMRSVARLVAAGKVRFVGLSEVSPRLLRIAHEIFPISCVQQEWSLASRSLVEQELVPVCRELSIGIVCYSPLARGLLTERTVDTQGVADYRANLPRFSGGNFTSNQSTVGEIVRMGERLHASVSQLTLAWLYQQAECLGVSICAIPGSSDFDHAIANIRALELRLSPEDFTALTELGARILGARHNEAYIAMGLEGLLGKE